MVVQENQEPVLYAPFPGQLCSGCSNEVAYTPIAGEAYQSADGDYVVIFECDVCGARGEVLARPVEKS
jgi:hypothetical protein